MIYIYVAIFFAALALGGTGAWNVQTWRYEAKDKARIEAQIELDRNNRKLSQAASEGLENDRTKTEIKYRTITREVEKIVERPVYLQQCFDADGLRALNAAIDATGSPGELKDAVPKP
jgi:hypothetical protein